MKRKIFIILVALVLALGLGLVLAAPAGANGGPTTWHVPGDCTTIQAAIDAASSGDAIHIDAGTYNETLNLRGKTLTIQGAGSDNTIVDASTFPGYAIQGFGDSTTIRNLKLIGTSNSYGFKVSSVSNITLQNIKVENSYKTGIDLNGVNGATLTNIEVVNTTAGFGVMICDSNNIVVTNVTTSGNAWGGVSVQTKNSTSDSIIFNGNFDAQEGIPLLLEKDPPTYYDISNVLIPSKFTHIVYALRSPDTYEQWFYQETLDDAKAFAQVMIATPPPFTYSKMLIYDIAEENYYVIAGMTIQDAVDAASGTTINVAAGTYDGAIVDKDVTISGAPGGASIITSGVPYKVGGAYTTAFRLDEGADGAEINNFTINNNEGTNFYFAVFARGIDGVTIDSLAINDTVQGITNWGGSNWVITNNVITDTVAAGGGGIGIFLGALPPDYRTCSNNLVQDNTINATATAADYSCPGICLCLDLRYGAYDLLDGTEDISGNQILSNDITASGANNGVGIEVGTILGNSEADPDRTDLVKIAAIMAAAAVHDNVVQENTSDGAYYGIYFYNVTDLTVTQNEIKNSVSDGIFAEHGQSGTIIQNNDFANNNIQLTDDTGTLDIESILDNNIFDRSVTVDRPGGSLLHTIWSKIQDGIDAAVGGDTVNVGAGMYTERITITKPLTLLGATWDVNKNGYTVPPGYAWDTSVESVINNPAGGEYNVVDIYATNDVTVKGFVIQALDIPAALNLQNLLRVYADAPGTCNNIVVQNNVIGPNTDVDDQDGTLGRMGLYLATPTYASDGFGITNSTFSGNKIFGCEGNGNNVFVWGAAKSYSSPARADYTGTVIEDNEIYGSHRSGIEIAGGVKNLVIRNNDIYGNSGYPGDDPILKYGTGIVVIRMGSDKTDPLAWGTDNLLIEDNNIHDNEKNGIYLGPINTNYNITGNKIYDNGWDGIRVDLTEEYHGGVNVVTDVASGITAQFNNIYDNVGYGVQVVGTPTNGFVFKATNNWWGHKSGPNHDTTNTSGSGNPVSDNVNYNPWIGASVEESKTETVTGDGTVDATGEADTEVIVNGSATVTVAEYSGNPSTGSFGGDTGKYVDVYIDDPAGVTEIEIRLYYTDAEISGMVDSTLKLLWWDGDSWEECSDSGVDTTDIAGPPPYSGYIWAKIRNDTTPTLEQLTGTPFGGSGSIAGSTWSGGGSDTIAPFIFNVNVQNITQTTADVSWSTNEAGTSQVEYGASPSTLSPLDTSLVMSHLVHLTGLTPTTTYHFKVMSVDAASNLAVSVEYTFNTLTPGGAPASFSVSGLSIQPLEIQGGEMVTITVSVTNTGGTGGIAGSYSVVLKINGVEEAEKSLTIFAGKSQSVSFSITRAEAGSYSVDVNGLSGSFTVAAAEAPPPAAAPIAWWIWVIVGVVVGGLVTFFLVRRRA